MHVSAYTPNLAALVVLYNPAESVITNVLSYSNFVSFLYVFDNSETPNDLLHQKIRMSYEGKNFIHISGNNKGIGEALNNGVAWAIRDGYAWLLTMDQDSSFYDGTFFAEFEKVSEKSQTAIFSPNHQLKDVKENLLSSSTTVNEMIVMTSGNLLNLNLFDKIGSFNSDLFIDEVDHDYCLRARKKGYLILKFIHIGLNHNLGSPQVVQRKWRAPYVASQHSALRVYYIVRNNLFIFKAYFFSFPGFIFSRFLNLMVFVKNILFYQDDKFLKLKYAFRGFTHFLIGRYGKL